MRDGKRTTCLQGADLPGLLLLFDRGSRPDREAVLDAVGRNERLFIAHDPFTAVSHGIDGRMVPGEEECERGLAVLADGLSFEILGLASGSPVQQAHIDHYLSHDRSDLEEVEALGIYPGSHIAEGANALPVVRTMLGLGADLAEALGDVRAISWTPARSAISVGFFQRSVAAWRAGGLFPTLGMVGIDFDQDDRLRTEGLSFLVGSELVLAPELSVDHSAAIRLVLHIVHELVGTRLEHGQHRFAAKGIEDMELVLEPGSGWIRVEPGPRQPVAAEPRSTTAAA